MLRRNSLPNKILAAYTKSVCTDLLTQTLRDPLARLCAHPRDFDLDSSHQNPMQLAENLRGLQEATSMFLEAIYNSVKIAPLPFRQVCLMLRTEAVRFFCPGIVTPVAQGLLASAFFSRIVEKSGVLRSLPFPG